MMEIPSRRRVIWASLALFLCGISLVASAVAEPQNDNRAPDLGHCEKLRVPQGHKVAFHAYAEGVQIYKWNGASWVFLGPEAVLYASGEGNGVIGTHYAGPTWET